MTGPAVDDPVVRAALQLLPVPEHAADFWDDLRLALARETAPDPVPVVAGMPDADPEVVQPLLPTSLRRPGNAVLVAVAVAAVVVVAAAGQSLLASRTGGASRRSSASAELEALVDRSQPVDAAPDALSSAEERSASGAVLAWIGALVRSEASEAWGALGPASQAHFGTATAFEEEMGDLVGAYAPWADANPTEVLVTPVATDEAGTLAVVTLVSPTATEAVPVRLADGAAKVEPIAPGAGLELVAPEAAADADRAGPLAPGEEILVVVPIGADAPLLRIDDGDVVACGETDGSRLTTLDDGSAQRCAYLPPEGVLSGRHTLTVALLGSEGSLLGARSVLFDAA